MCSSRMRKLLRIYLLLILLLSLLAFLAFFLFFSTDDIGGIKKLDYYGFLDKPNEEVEVEEVWVDEDKLPSKYNSIYDNHDRIFMERIQASQSNKCWFNATYDGYFHDPDIPRRKCTISWVGWASKGAWICSSFRREYCCHRFEMEGGHKCQHVPYDVQVTHKDDWSANIVTVESKHWTTFGRPFKIPVGKRTNETMLSMIQLESVDEYLSYLNSTFFTELGDKRVDNIWGYSEDFFPKTNTFNYIPDLAYWKILLDMKYMDFNFDDRDFASVYQSDRKFGCTNWERTQFIRYMVRTSERLYTDEGDENKVVHSYGDICRNSESKKTGWDEKFDEKHEMESKHKFTFALEKYLDDWTASPQIWNSLYSGAVPVFVGARRIDEMWPFGNNKGYINVRDFGDVREQDTWEKVLEYMYEVGANKTRWMEFQNWREEEFVTREWYERWGSRSLMNFMCNSCEYYHEHFLPGGGHGITEEEERGKSQEEYTKPYRKIVKCTKSDESCGPLL